MCENAANDIRSNFQGNSNENSGGEEALKKAFRLFSYRTHLIFLCEYHKALGGALLADHLLDNLVHIGHTCGL